MSTVISVENLSKSYHLGQIGTGTLTNDLKVWFAKIRGKSNPLLKIGQIDLGNRDGEELWALKDVNFEVKQGEVLGVIGRNGAGKSTLLKILSRVTAPTSGCIKVKGRIASLLEVGTGFHPELTGRENIYLNGAILGMTKEEVRHKFDEIVAFAEIEKFIDTPVKRYSSGMYVRLAFAVAAHLESEILLVDEVLAVGDVEFQKKCLGKMNDVASNEGRTVLFVSHNMAAIQKLCNRSILVSFGKISKEGDTIDVTHHYLQEKETLASIAPIRTRTDRKGQGNIKLVDLRIEDERGQNTLNLFSGKQASFLFELNVNDPKITLNFGIYDRFGVNVASFVTSNKGETDKVHLNSGNTYVCSIPEVLLPPEDYTVNVLIKCNGIFEDHLESAIRFQVSEGYLRGRQIKSGGRAKALIPHQWTIPS